MQSNVVHPEESWAQSLLECFCCWNCIKGFVLFFTGTEDTYERFDSASQQSGTHATGQTRVRVDERSRLLNTPSKGGLPGRRPIREEDPEMLMQAAGVPKFPKKISKQETESLSKKEKHDFVDVCPTCLELYTPEDPKITTNCGHHFHLACIYEWLERSQTCPVCFRPMSFEELE